MRERISHLTRTGGLNKLLQRQLWLILPTVVLALLVALISSVKLEVQAPRVSTRMVQYLHIGQLQADVRTLVATVQYIMTAESEAPRVNIWSNLPVAGIATPTPPHS